jgi:hypothetical protein
MSAEKAKEIVEKISIEWMLKDDVLDEFVVALGSLHSNLNTAIEIASLMSSDGDLEGFSEIEDAGGEDEDLEEEGGSLLQPYEEPGRMSEASPIGDLKKSLELAFEEAGLSGVSDRLSELVSGFVLDLNSLNPFQDEVEFFIKEYGFVDFVSDDFAEISFAMSPGARKTPPVEAEPIPFISGTRPEDRRSKKPWKTLDRLNPIQNLYNNMSIEQAYFEGEDSEHTYYARLAKAQEADPDVTALNYHKVFKKLNDDVTGFVIDESTSPPKVVVSLDKMAAVRQAVISSLQAISSATREAKQELSAAGGSHGAETLSVFEGKRASYANALDDLVAAIKKRDGYLTAKLYSDYEKEGLDVAEVLERKPYSISKIVRDKNSQIFKLLYDLAVQLVFVDIEGDVHQYKYNVDKKFAASYDSNLREEFERQFRQQLNFKIKAFFNKSTNGAWLRASFCHYLAGSIKRSMLHKLAYNKKFGIVTTSWNYATCSMCGKNVYTRKRQDTPKGAGRKGGTVNIKEYSEYKTDLYSLFRKNGDLITERMLRFEEDGSTVRRFSPPPSLAAESNADGMTWDEIIYMLRSGGKRQHIEGVKWRAWALKQMGAVKLFSGETSVSNIKFKCPYESEEDRPKSLRSLKNTLVDFECGMYLDAAPLFEEGGSGLSPSNLQALRAGTKDLSPRELFELQLDKALDAGIIDESKKQSFLDELSFRQGGGWKFSNKYFNCPTKIIIPEEHQEKQAFREQGYLKRFSYIASPIAGPIADNKISMDDEPGGRRIVNVDDTYVYPPSDGQGGYAVPENSTLSYLVCGAQTSLSSFSRSETEDGSLPRLLKSLMFEAKSDPLIAAKMQNFIETLITLGVDSSDIIPFITNISDPDIAIAELENAGRLEKISHILAVAMAAPVDMEAKYHGSSFNRIDLLGDIKLVCSHGHKFTVKDSVYFGKTHTGINLRNKRRARYSFEDIYNSGILFSNGEQNFKDTLRLSSRNGDKYVVAVDPSDMLGGDKDRKYSYEEWVDKTNDPRRVAFDGLQDSESLYSFSSIPSWHIWGSEERYGLSSARQRESRDQNTIIEIENNRELDTGARTDSGGNPRGVDSGTKAAKEMFDRQETLQVGSMSELKESGPEGIVKATTPVGRILRSFLYSMQSWLKLSTTLEIRGCLSGPTPFDVEEDGELGESLSEVSSKIIELLVRVIEQEDEEGDSLSRESSEIITAGVKIFNEEYLSKFKNLDRGLMSTLGASLEEAIMVGIVNSVVNAGMNILGNTEQERAEVLSAYSQTLLSNNSIDYAYVRGLEYGGNSLGSLVSEFVSRIAPELSKKDTERTLYDPLAVKQVNQKGRPPSVDKNYFQEGVPQKGEGITDKIAKMKGKEYMCRVLKASSALYIADVVSNAYNLYMRDPNSREFIGYDIGIDLSSAEKVLGLTEEQLNSIVIGVDESTSELMDSMAERFYENHYENITDCVRLLKNEMFVIRTACTSSKYMSKAVEYVQEYFREFIDNSRDEEEAGDIKRAEDIVNKVMTNHPFTTISLNSDGKYKAHFGGSGKDNVLEPPKDPSGLIPVFGNELVKYNGDRSGALYPIFALAKRGIVYHSFPFDVPEPNRAKVMYVLSKKALPDAIELEDLYDRIPELYRRNGWKIYSTKLGKSSSEYSIVSGKEGGLKKGVSMIYHPATISITEDEGGALLGYSNEEFGFDTTQALFLGTLTMRVGKDNLFPPSPIDGISNVGVPIPLNCENKDSDQLRAKRKLFPIVGTRIPISLNTSVPGEMMQIDVSDFLQRDPPHVAFEILRKINNYFTMYQEDLKRAIYDGATAPQQALLRERYKEVIAKLFSTYRGLPFRVQNSKSGTKRVPSSAPPEGVQSPEHADKNVRPVSEKFEPRVSPYIPLIDWVTMHKMITEPQYGPEWGGHQLWSAEDGDETINERREALEQFLIKAHGLERFANLLGERLDSDPKLRDLEVGTTMIDPTDLLDPVNRLFKKGLITAKESKKLFNYDIGEDSTYTSDDGFPWVRLADKSRDAIANQAAQKINTVFGRWVKGTNNFYSIGLSGETDSMTEEPHAYIKVMNVVFPSNKVGTGQDASPRERLGQVRSEEGGDILNIRDLYSHDIISGAGGTDLVYYPVPKDPEKLQEYLKKLKDVRHISVIRYAEAISEFLINNVLTQLQDVFKKESMHSYGPVKYSKKLNANMYYGGIIMDTELRALWTLINK